MGSISVTQTLAPAPLMDCAHPLPTSPKPQMRTFLPQIMTSVALLRPSMRECLQPQILSNLDFVTESLTLMKGQMSFPSLSNLQRRATPVVVSSETPTKFLLNLEKQCLSVSRYLLMVFSSQYSSSDPPLTGSTNCSVSLNLFSASNPWIRYTVASPPSSTIMSGPSPFPQLRQSLVSSQYSSRVSPFQAKTSAVLASAMQAAAWSWVEKMLHEHHLTLAPRAWRVSMRQAVWMVM